ncbi:helix-turn-helix domain-containing protein [Streptomyces sp. NPDC088812]|uniref:helix-turn-helix domain-containing protein n=1 Tax=Streptomyces sp. NPDC088812 TaxID=3365905 RepID=UPI00380FB1B9
MTNYDDVSAKVAADEAMLRISMAGEAELEHRHGPSEHPLDGLDSESLASFNLKRIRTELGVSQQQIADRISAARPGGARMSQTQIAKIERGERPWRVNELMMVAEALGVQWDEFFAVTPGQDYARLAVEAARLRYEQAKSLEEEAREAWREAARREYEAEEEFVRRAARSGYRHPHALFALQMRWMHQDYVKRAEEFVGIDTERIRTRATEADAFAEREWQRIVEEEERRRGGGEADG